MILLGIGGNLPSVHGAPLDTCRAALDALGPRLVTLVCRSRWYRSAPWPPSDQPWFVNAVVEVETALPPERLLGALNEIEALLGRVRGQRNAARVVDLDVLDYRGWQISTSLLDLPHPRMTERAFVLQPLADIAPRWRHPRSGVSLAQLIAALPPDQTAEPID